jgi:tripartite-type tricarboxylate transporter receptor subunit TctC
MMGLRAIRAAVTAVSMAAVLAGVAVHAQDAYPSQLVKVVVPAAAGSTTDTLARVVADQLARKWGKPVVVENIAGGGMNTGAAQVARSAPDGYTLMVAPPAPITFAHLLIRNLNYDPRDWVPITMLAKIANVLAVRSTLPASSVKELIAYAKAHPGKLTFATQGPGSTAHLSAAQLELLAGIEMVAIPYRGAQLALNDLIAGNVDMFFDTLATSVPLLRGGKLRILAVADLERAQSIPEVPTFSEAGLPGFRSITWFGLVAPPGTPPALAQRINTDAVDILRSPEAGESLQRLSLEVGATSLAETTKFFAGETALWSRVIEQTGITPQ